MKTYRVIFTPVEPYFFGNEKTFRFGGERSLGLYDTPYFIRSERTPAQTTIFGAIRYLLLTNRHSNFNKGYPDGYADIIGRDSFKITQENQTFGKIKSISPIFLYYDGDETAADKEKLPKKGIYLPAPFDHNVNIENTETYLPYKRADIDDKKEYAPGYDPKAGIADSYMHLGSGEIVKSKEIFRPTVRVGIDVKKIDDAFFKREYQMLNKGWSFGIYLTVDDDTVLPTDKSVFLGQNKAAFKVEFIDKNDENDDLTERLENLLTEKSIKGIIYCLSDTFVTSAVYKDCSFAITQTRDHRSYETKREADKDRPIVIKKGGDLHKLIKAGSVFFYKSDDQKQALLAHLKNRHCEIIGMNHICTK